MGGGFGRRSVIGRVVPPAEDESATRIAGPETLEANRTAAARSAEAGPAPEEKYRVVARIGRGGMGDVDLVRDVDLGRDVAMKSIRAEHAASPEMRLKFVAEARTTSQLEHPGIPPVHDLGARDDGSLYFTMKVVRGRTLGQVLRDLLIGVAETRREFTLHRLVGVLERVAEAVAFAHEKGVLHRDLKPDNIMLGAFGEVHVMDWGLAKAESAPEPESSDGRAEFVDAGADRPVTADGTIQGTVPYMSPEQAAGSKIDVRSDVYALGVILYEVLTLHRAFEGSSDLLRRVRNGEFPDVASRHPSRPVPPDLGDLCRSAMRRDPAARPSSARQFSEELRRFLDGRAERSRRKSEAEAFAAKGAEAMSRYRGLARAVIAADEAARRLESSYRLWQPAEQKRPAREARAAVGAAGRAAALALAEGSALLDAALLADPRNPVARAEYAAVWSARLQEAEHRGIAGDASLALEMLRQFDDGARAAEIKGDGRLDLDVDPPGARVALVELADDLGILVHGPERDLGPAPVRGLSLAMGTYVAFIRAPGYPEVRYPIHITRGRRWKGRVRLRTEREIGAGFVFVPAGPFLCGDGESLSTEELGDFAIAAMPVTFGDWARFLDATEREHGRAAALALVPRTPITGNLMERDADRGWQVVESLVAGAARDWCEPRHGAGFALNLPVCGVTALDAEAYCRWRGSDSDGAVRLPTQREREKAARGVDGRPFPWGSLADNSLCRCNVSRETGMFPEPVGAFPVARSVYGMVDAAGSSWDLTSTVTSTTQGGEEFRALAGGSWRSPVAYAKCAYYSRLRTTDRLDGAGMRLARSLPDRD